MDGNIQSFDQFDGYTVAEIEVEAETMIMPSELEVGATILVSNESDGNVERIISHEELSKYFAPPVAMPIPTEVAVERTLADPALKQILQEADPDFDPEAEQMKIRDFLAGVTNNKMTTEETVFQAAPRQSLPSSNACGIIKCSNCGGLFEILTFQNHTCDYDGNQALIEVPPSQEKRLATVAAPPKKPASERVILENQVRIRRFMKDELRYDIKTGFDVSRTKKPTKGPNECSMCERKFVHASGLVRHMEKHALDLIPTQLAAPSIGSNTVVHGLRVVLKCEPCGRIFCEIKMALEHSLVHFPESSPKPEASSTNELSYTELAQLMNVAEQLVEVTDVKAEQENPDKETDNIFFSTVILSGVLQCEFCDYIFADIGHLLAHSATHLPERRFECSACDICMNTSKEASTHFQADCVFMREGLKQANQVSLNRYFVCNVCELKFNNSELLQEHRYSCFHYFPRLSIDRTQLLLPCEFCEVNFEYAHEIQPHYEEKHLNKKRREKDARNCGSGSGRLRQYLCDICGKSYTQSSHLWQHLRFHQGVKPFVCQEDGCGRKFTIRPDLNDHIRKCHTGERPYHCLVCGKRFLTGSVFYQHRLIHRGERRYECEECGKRFYRADALKNHQRIHTGEKPYSCLFCTKTFRQRGDRDKHIRARHAHLDANSRLMMQMQKFQLESAAAAAALKAKKLQEHHSGCSSLDMTVNTNNMGPSPPFAMLPQPQGEMFAGAVNEYVPGSFENIQSMLPQLVQGVPMSLNNVDSQMIVYQDPTTSPDMPMPMSMQGMTMNSTSIFEPPSPSMENNENAKVVVVMDKHTPPSLYF
ncbi:testis-specific zinc finger protein topi [Scaptodrosophila lebanonensis]|uniref:Testis-specific zinc finger protein topi n=1 Tax=Drosophila lebanonensis TaxID=7225 RepID=A0A6J2T2J8_DROLE|nr:testis-specific zinc finger protein topi [Scaptodrosophila lebanonensis]